jgi:hypothetical protein
LDKTAPLSTTGTNHYNTSRLDKHHNHLALKEPSSLLYCDGQKIYVRQWTKEEQKSNNISPMIGWTYYFFQCGQITARESIHRIKRRVLL